MTSAELDKLPDAELNRLAAELIMGWTWNPNKYGQDNGGWTEYESDDFGSPFLPATDHNDAALLLDEIERQGLLRTWCARLIEIVKGYDFWQLRCKEGHHTNYNFEDVEAVANASARNKTKAAILAVGGK